jgi:hypothetical protein
MMSLTLDGGEDGYDEEQRNFRHFLVYKQTNYFLSIFAKPSRTDGRLALIRYVNDNVYIARIYLYTYVYWL